MHRPIPTAKHPGISARMWLYMLTAGGWHTASEIAAACNIEYTSAARNLRSLCRSGSARARRADNSRPTQFGVTPACFTPGHITVGTISEALSDATTAAATHATVHATAHDTTRPEPHHARA